MNVPGEELFAVAGIWRPSTEWGDCYSMIMTEAAGDAALVHSRMPVILAAADHASWLEQPMPDVLDLCRPWAGPISVNRTEALWARK
jgi:putative SOS response-associated peptidase YedK